MALPTDEILPARKTFFVGDVAYKRATSEALMFKVGSAVNFIMDRIIYTERVSFGGYFRSTSIDEFSEKIYIHKRTQISHYTMSVGNTVSAGDNSMNFAVYGAAGAFISNLFSVAPIINESSKNQMLVGRDVDATTNIQQITTAGFNFGTLAITELQAGYTLVPFVVSNAFDSRGLFFNLGLKVQE